MNIKLLAYALLILLWLITQESCTMESASVTAHASGGVAQARGMMATGGSVDGEARKSEVFWK